MNKFLKSRLTAIQKQLISVYEGGDGLSSSSKGSEREIFINYFLAGIMPPVYRFGFGDITDVEGNKSGQVDIVVENQFFPSIPMVGAFSPRLYLAEGVLAALEVKSDISKQLDEAEDTAKKIKELKKSPESVNAYAGTFAEDKINGEIPVFAVGYKGWNSIDKVKENLAKKESIDGILVIDPGFFVYKNKLFEEGTDYTGAESLWGLIRLIHEAGAFVMSTSFDLGDYLTNPE